MSNQPRITQDDIIALTRQHGESWAYPHVNRILALARRISGDLSYHPDWFWYAAYLHDWGAFPAYRQPGLDHALRSRQIAECEILPFCGLPSEALPIILEAIERHDYRDPLPVHSPEALLLREADFLDFLGPLGIAREFAWGPNDLSRVITRIHSRISGIQGRFTLPAAQEIAAQRIAAMQTILSQIEEDGLGFL